MRGTNRSHPAGIYHALNGHYAQGAPETGGVAQLSAPDKEPAVAIEKSVFPDYIICLEDGKKLKMLKRHLMAACLRHVARIIPRTLEPPGHLSGDRTELFGTPIKNRGGNWSWAQGGFHDAGGRAGAALEGGRQWKKGPGPPEEERHRIARRYQRQQRRYLARASAFAFRKRLGALGGQLGSGV
jgi:ROS/MUCR transcriptional regulator protein